MSGARDLHATLTNQIIAAIEKGAGEFQMPWHHGGATSRPWNAASGKRYGGINIISLWIAAEASAYPHPIWATYKQWSEKGAQVRRGERSSLIVFYKTLDVAATNDATGDAEQRRVPLARASHVFNIAQVDGATPPDTESLVAAQAIDPIAAADHVARQSGAVIREGGARAFYSPRDDLIAMPDRALFTGTATMSATEAWYATLLHELTHWTGGEKRLKRSLTARFGENAYAMEELVAELGAAYLCADLGVTPALRPDHAAYIQSWLTVLRADTRAIFTAAARAQDAAALLLSFAPDALRLDPANQPAGTEGESGNPVPTPPDGFAHADGGLVITSASDPN